MPAPARLARPFAQMKMGAIEQSVPSRIHHMLLRQAYRLAAAGQREFGTSAASLLQAGAAGATQLDIFDG